METPEQHSAECPNCDSPLGGNYCSSCGQKNQPLRQPVWKFISDAFGEYFGIDGRLWHTIARLVAKPGQLTIDYVEGRRVRYLRPLRMYLIATVLFFFLISVIDPVGNIEEAVSFDPTATSDTTDTVAGRLSVIDKRLSDDEARLFKQIALTDSIKTEFDLRTSELSTMLESADSTDTLVVLKRVEVIRVEDDWDDAKDDLSSLRKQLELREKRFIWQHSVLSALPPDSVIRPSDYHAAAVRVIPDEGSKMNINLPSWLPQSSAVRRLNAARSEEEKRAAFAAFARGAIEKAPIAIFFMLPFFALLLKMIFVRRNWFYTEHLVFGLHTHAFAFLMFTVMAIFVSAADGASWTDQLNLVLMFVTMLYFIVAMKRVYRQGWIKTLIKSFLVGAVYNFIMLLGLIMALLLAAALD